MRKNNVNNVINLKKMSVEELNIDELYKTVDELKWFLEQDVNPENTMWETNFENIIDFQDEDGFFNLLDTKKIPSDARVDFCYMPTYICTAILIKAYQTDEYLIEDREVLYKALKACCGRKLRGHGLEAEEDFKKVLRIFSECGIEEFLVQNGEMVPEFTEMFEGQFEEVNLFVYGTLMEGGVNYGDYLSKSKKLGKGVIRGYDTHLVGDIKDLPAVVKGDGLAIGELYRVPKEQLADIDILEGNGEFYTREVTVVETTKGTKVFAFVYVKEMWSPDEKSV